jgi:hypothetical protein
VPQEGALSNNLFFDDDDDFMGVQTNLDPKPEPMPKAENEPVPGANLFFVDEADNDFVNEHEIRITMQREVDEMCLTGREPSFNVLHFEDELQRRLRERRK